MERKFGDAIADLIVVRCARRVSREVVNRRLRIRGKKMTEQTRTSPSASTRGSRPKPLLLIAVVAVILGIVIWRLAFATPKVPDNIVVLSGRIEGDDSALAPKTSGGVAEIRSREGDSLKAGDTIAVLDDEQVRAREDQAGAKSIPAHREIGMKILGPWWKILRIGFAGNEFPPFVG